MALYTESPEDANAYREEMLAQVKGLVRRERRRADRRRARFFRPSLDSLEAYEDSTRGYREQFQEMLGWPLTLPPPGDVPRAREVFVAEDDLGRIYRMWIETLPGLDTYGLFFLPKGDGPFPLVISQHGGGGTPELCSGFFGSANYNDMTRRVLRHGFAVFAPQLLLWNPDPFGPTHDKDGIDRRLKQLGGSLAALEIFRLQRSLDCLIAREDVDGSKVGMIGLSYGGFYTLFTAAVELRIRVAVSSCFFSNRKVYDLPDWTWFDAANRFFDAEVASLVCPRSLYVEVGKQDTLFAVRYAGPEAAKVRAVYEQLGIPERFRYKEHEGGHELDTVDDGIEFLCGHVWAME